MGKEKPPNHTGERLSQILKEIREVGVGPLGEANARLSTKLVELEKVLERRSISPSTIEPLVEEIARAVENMDTKLRVMKHLQSQLWAVVLGIK